MNPVDDAALAAGADAWLASALTAAPADRPAAEAGVAAAYALAGLAAPSFEWADSPRAGAERAHSLRTAGEVSVRRLVRTEPWALARADLTERLGSGGWARHWAAAGARTWQLVTDRLVTPLRRRLDEELPGIGLTLLDAVHGQHDGAWLGAFPGDPRLGGLADVARAAGWWWPYERVAVLTERPVAIHRDNLGRLHHGDGPALSYPDSWGMFAWRGMPIPPAVAEILPHLTVTRIQAESNAEVRRVMLEYFGFDRYLRESGAKRLHSDECGVLWRVEIPGDEPLVMVEVVNSTPEPDGTSRTYFLRVPPSIRTAREGVAWTFNIPPEQYSPLHQT